MDMTTRTTECYKTISYLPIFALCCITFLIGVLMVDVSQNDQRFISHDMIALGITTMLFYFSTLGNERI